LLELGSGFHPDFSGRENILMNGVLLGRSRRTMRATLDAILEFAELEGVADAPVRTYSTGMAMRLAFATALGVEPDVLLLDEVLAVGDLAFQEKCIERLFAFRAAGGTLVLCSHSLYDLRQICDRALWLADGRPAGLGDSASVTSAYAAWAGAQGAGQRAEVDPGPGRPRITALECRADGGPVRDAVESGAELELRVSWENPSGRPLALGVTLTRQDRTLLAGLGTHLDGLLLEGSRGCMALTLPRLSLLAGRFQVVAHLFDERGVHRHHERAADAELVVRAATREVGLVRLEHAWRVVEPQPEVAA
jgi:lipopolysaccharide transport system ATP-binding protein